MSRVSSCSCFCSFHWSQVLSREWRCSWNSASSDAPTTSEWSLISWPTDVRFILEVYLVPNIPSRRPGFRLVPSLFSCIENAHNILCLFINYEWCMLTKQHELICFSIQRQPGCHALLGFPFDYFHAQPCFRIQLKVSILDRIESSYLYTHSQLITKSLWNEIETNCGGACTSVVTESYIPGDVK